MKLLSLQLKYFRQHAQSSIEFPAGLVGIIGHNGAGKTSLVEAIAFALYGAKAIRGKVEYLVTRGAPAKAEATAALVFEHEGIGYTVRRTTESAELFRGGEPEPIAEGSRDVSTRIAQILGMNHDEFVATYFTEQKGLEFLSGKKGAAERERFIVRMMGYDRLEKVQEALRADRRDKKAELAGWEASLGSRGEVEARLSGESEALKTLETRFLEAGQALERADKEAQMAKTALEKIEGFRAPWLKLREAEKKLVIQLEEGEKRGMKLIGELHRLREALGGGDEVKSVAAALADLPKLLGKIEVGEGALRESEERGKKLELGWREGVAKGRSDLEGAKKEVAKLLDAEKKRGALKPGSKCPTCAQELGANFEAVQAHHQSEVARSEEEVRRLEGQLKVSEAEPAEYRAAIVEITEARSRLAALRAHRDRLLSLERAVEGVTRTEREIAEWENVRNGLRTELEAVREEITRSRFSEEGYNQERTKAEAAARLLEVARLQKVRLEGEVGTQRALRDRTAAELRTYDDKAAALVERRQLLALLDDGDQALTDFRKHLNASIRPRLAELASEFLAELTDGRYTTVEISADFSPTVLEDGEPKPIISGGEEDILNLCLRLALSNMLAERAGQAFSLLMLDEVFGSLDEGRRTNVLGLLEKLHQRFEQILIITHLDDIKDGVESLIEIAYDDATGAVRVGAGAFDVEDRLIG
ncbi:MAG: hypothetical protein RL417_1475 [Pseudomonadota bacterium]|jgi:exonuclease SbcC